MVFRQAFTGRKEFSDRWGLKGMIYLWDNRAMMANATFDTFFRDADGSFSTAHGPYTLHTAFQPLFEPDPTGPMIAGFHGQIRIERMGDSYSPAEFLHAIEINDMALLDCQMAALHLCNAAIFSKRGVQIHVTRNPRFFSDAQAMRDDAARLAAHAVEAGLNPAQVVCELMLRDYEDLERAQLFASHLRRAGFILGIYGFAGEERDMERLQQIRPTFVRLDPIWLADFLANSAGLALLRVILSRFREQNILAIASGLEQEEHVLLVHELGFSRLQGHALARPEMAPESFAANHTFSRGSGIILRKPDIANPLASPPSVEMAAAPRRVASPSFGRRGLG